MAPPPFSHPALPIDDVAHANVKRLVRQPGFDDVFFLIVKDFPTQQAAYEYIEQVYLQAYSVLPYTSWDSYRISRAARQRRSNKK